MISEKVKQHIDALAARYPRKESALMPALDAVQKANNNSLARSDIEKVASLLGVTHSKAYGVATYYTMFNNQPVGQYHLQVDTNVPAMLAGADEIMHHLQKKLGIRDGETSKDGLFTLCSVQDLGACGTCPVIQVNDTYYENMTPEKTDNLLDLLRRGIMLPPVDDSNFGSECNILLKNRGKNSPTLATYRQSGGYKGMAKALTMKSEEIIELVKQASLRGRGGAGFPAGIKWSFLPKNDPRPVYLICNADEGEPGTFKDRQIMQYDPHLLVEGIAIAAHAVGAKMAFIYIRGEFRWIAEILEKAIDEAKQNGLLAHVQIVVHRGAGSYVCGEETALIESLEGKRGNPRLKPPFPANVGLYGCPTVVNNVETLACLPYILENGAEAFRKIGSMNNFGPKLYGVSGHVNRPGVYEFPLGTQFSKILEAAGGVKGGNLKAAIVGGLSVPIMHAKELESLKMDYDACMKAGTMLGSGGIMVMNETVSIPKVAERAIHFYAHESCGQCTPCREGSQAVLRLLHQLVHGEGHKADIDKILQLCARIKGSTLCPTGDAFAVPIEAMVMKFRDEFEALVQSGTGSKH